jgi:oxygen-independent coproporphyrinogen III oxidase
MTGDIPSGLYVHVPFCQSKCPYCDFYSATDLSLIPRWMEALRKEVDFYKGRFPDFDTLYLGGGSPSRLSENQFELLWELIRGHFHLNADPEITIEVNPDDLNPSKIKTFRDLGVNRISLGVQSFDPRELLFLRRRHTIEDVQKALENIRAAGFINVGIDLIYGLPGQTKEQWLATLEKALAFQPEHLSCYQLTITKGTLFGGLKEKGRLQPLRETEEEAFFLATSRFLENQGYTHYEISNYAREEKFFSSHNQKYWQRCPYLGLGPAAHSFQGNHRWWNVRSVNQYCRALEDGLTPVEGQEELNEEQILMEMISLSLRTRAGLDLNLLGGKPNLEKILQKLSQKKWVTVNGTRLVPTIKGFLVADRLPLFFE